MLMTWARANRSDARTIARLGPIDRSQAVTAKPRNRISSDDRGDDRADERAGAARPPTVPVGGSGLAGSTWKIAGRSAPTITVTTMTGSRERGADREVVDGPPVEAPDPHLGPRQRPRADDGQPDDADEDGRVSSPTTSWADRRVDRRRGRRGRDRARNPTTNADEVRDGDDRPEDEERRRPGVRRTPGPPLERLVAARRDQPERQQPGPDEIDEHAASRRTPRPARSPAPAATRASR